MWGISSTSLLHLRELPPRVGGGGGGRRRRWDQKSVFPAPDHHIITATCYQNRIWVSITSYSTLWDAIKLPTCQTSLTPVLLNHSLPLVGPTTSLANSFPFPDRVQHNMTCLNADFTFTLAQGNVLKGTFLVWLYMDSFCENSLQQTGIYMHAVRNLWH